MHTVQCTLITVFQTFLFFKLESSNLMCMYTNHKIHVKQMVLSFSIFLFFELVLAVELSTQSFSLAGLRALVSAPSIRSRTPKAGNHETHIQQYH